MPCRQNSESEAFGWSLIFAAVLSCCLLLLLVQPRPNKPVILVVPPFSTNTAIFQVVARAQTRLLAAEGAAWAVIVYDEEPELSERLYRSGAWLVLDPTLIVACLGLSESRAQKQWGQRG
ncbi:MAG: hypothetical protein ACR2OW_14040 [Methyloligellaceae bacterium]